jgi:hypothetical protein
MHGFVLFGECSFYTEEILNMNDACHEAVLDLLIMRNGLLFKLIFTKLIFK